VDITIHSAFTCEICAPCYFGHLVSQKPNLSATYCQLIALITVLSDSSGLLRPPLLFSVVQSSRASGETRLIECHSERVVLAKVRRWRVIEGEQVVGPRIVHTTFYLRTDVLRAAYDNPAALPGECLQREIRRYSVLWIGNSSKEIAVRQRLRANGKNLRRGDGIQCHLRFR
jgi:hypothetical protein